MALDPTDQDTVAVSGSGLGFRVEGWSGEAFGLSGVLGMRRLREACCWTL